MHIDIHGGIGTLNSLLQELSLLMDKVAVAFPSLCSVQPWCNRHRNNGRCGNSGHKLPPYVDVMETIDPDTMGGRCTLGLLIVSPAENMRDVVIGSSPSGVTLDQDTSGK